MSKQTRSVGPTDRLVGKRICAQRVFRGLSRSALASSIGVTFQQLQKYEKGINRITVGKLCEIAAALQLDVTNLLPDARKGTSALPEFANLTGIDLQIVAQLSSITDGPFKIAVLHFLQVVNAAPGEEEHESK